MTAKRILIVEDSPTQAVRLARELEGTGYEVETAASGEEGLEAARRRVPDAAVVDILLPGMDGYAFVRELRGDPATAGVPVVVLTRLGAVEDVMRALEAGANAFMTKPYRLEELVAQIEFLLAHPGLREAGGAGGRLQVEVGGRRFELAADRMQILDVLFTSIEHLVRTSRELEERNRELEAALEEIRKLQELVPICAGCKKIRNDQGYWEQLEAYFSEHAGVRFSHGLCPECREKYLPPLDGGAGGK